MFDQEYEVPKPVSLPTYRQYVKTLGKGALGKTAFPVDIIWVPGKFNNFTLQTHAFRMGIPENSGLYANLEEFVSGIVPENECARFDVYALPGENYPFKFSLNLKHKGKWKRLGANGFKFEAS